LQDLLREALHADDRWAWTLANGADANGRCDRRAPVSAGDFFEPTALTEGIGDYLDVVGDVSSVSVAEPAMMLLLAGLTAECAERMAVSSMQNVLDFFAGRIDSALVVDGSRLSGEADLDGK
jgi:hypothetical protein